MADVNLGLRSALHHLRQKMESMMAKEMEYMNLLTDMQQVIHHANSAQEWVVVVCPKADTAASCSQILAASISGDSRFSGRTAVLKSGGRVSVVVAFEDVFVPDGMPFGVSFLGWTSKNKNDGMAKWQQKATAVLRLGD